MKNKRFWNDMKDVGLKLLRLIVLCGFVLSAYELIAHKDILAGIWVVIYLMVMVIWDKRR